LFVAGDGGPQAVHLFKWVDTAENGALVFAEPFAAPAPMRRSKPDDMRESSAAAAFFGVAARPALGLTSLRICAAFSGAAAPLTASKMAFSSVSVAGF
jgi:hypothetical protein